MKQTSWWQERVVGGLSSYWVYQHIGNLSPQALADDGLYQKVREHGGDCEPMLREFATAADAEADGHKGAQWSYRRDLGDVRLLVIDSRCGRMLDEGDRSMVSDREFEWIEAQVAGDYDHLLVGTSLPWLLARALHDIEAWNETLAAGRRGPGWRGWPRSSAGPPTSSTGRRSASPSTGSPTSSPASAAATTPVPTGGRPRRCACCPATSTTRTPRRPTTTTTVRSSVFQLTCSPVHNYVPRLMQVAFRVSWSRAAEKTTRFLLDRVARLPAPAAGLVQAGRPLLRQRDRDADPRRPGRPAGDRAGAPPEAASSTCTPSWSSPSAPADPGQPATR